MFGIIMGVVSTGAAIIDGIKRGHENVQAIKRGYQRQLDGTDNTNTYFDIHGNRRDLKTHQIRKVDFAIVESHGQDRCIRDQNGNVVRNYTEEKREARRKEAIANNRTVYMYRKLANGIYSGEEHREFGGDGYCEGTQFKDLKTGQIYVARTQCICSSKALGKNLPWNAGCVALYMSLDGKFIRESDSVVLKRKRGEIVPTREMIDEYIEKANKREKPKPKKDEFGNIIKNDAKYLYNLGEYYQNTMAVPGDV